MPRADPQNSNDAGQRRDTDALLGLGSNVGDKAQNIARAIAMLQEAGDVRVVRTSRLYRTLPWGVTDQDWFVNACVAVATELAPRALLHRCLGVENAMGRVRERHWGPRLIDVDVLTYGDRAISEPDLIVPHPRMAERAFVLVPLQDVAPDFTLRGVHIADLIARLDANDVAPLDAEK